MISFIILLSLCDNIIWYKCYRFLNLDLFTVFKKYIIIVYMYANYIAKKKITFFNLFSRLLFYYLEYMRIIP